jgi:hypothetical protein
MEAGRAAVGAPGPFSRPILGLGPFGGWANMPLAAAHVSPQLRRILRRPKLGVGPEGSDPCLLDQTRQEGAVGKLHQVSVRHGSVHPFFGLLRLSYTAQ